MALTAKQRARLPPSAFAYPAKRAYPVPTKAQAAKAGISGTHRRQGHERPSDQGDAQPTVQGTQALMSARRKEHPMRHETDATTPEPEPEPQPGDDGDEDEG